MTDIYLAQGARLAARRLESETIILRPDDSGLYILNALGTLLWEAADGRTPLATVVERVICREFDVDQATAERDALAFVTGLQQHQILTVSDQPIAAGDAPGRAGSSKAAS